MATLNIITLPGDGIGREIMPGTLEVLRQATRHSKHQLRFEEHLIGGASIDAHGTALTDEVLAACKASNGILLGAVGGPKWTTTDPDAPRPEQGLLGLRKGLGYFLNIRPVEPFPELYDQSTLKPEILQHVNLTVMRELTGGIYFGDHQRTDDMASDLCIYTVAEIERFARVVFQLAEQNKVAVTSVDKANVLETSRLWREVVTELHDKEFAGVTLNHMLVDNAAMQLVSNPGSFGYIMTENMFGDILSDEAAVLTGSIGMLPSMSFGLGGPGLYEPIHGSAPDIAGQGIANPFGIVLSGASMLEHGLGMKAEAAAIRAAVKTALFFGRTSDLGGDTTTDQAIAMVLQYLKG